MAGPEADTSANRDEGCNREEAVKRDIAKTWKRLEPTVPMGSMMDVRFFVALRGTWK